MPYDLFSPLSQKVSIHIHETWEPSCGQNHELFFWLLPQIWCSQSSFYPWSIHWEKFQSIKKRKPTKNPTLDSFLGLCGGWPLHLTPLGHYLMLSTSLFQGLGIAWQLPITSSFFSSILLLPVCCPSQASPVLLWSIQILISRLSKDLPVVH